MNTSSKLIFLSCLLLLLLTATLLFMRQNISPGETKDAAKSGKKLRMKRQNPGIGDESNNDYEVITTRLPLVTASKDQINDRYMPTLSNGYIGTTVYSTVLYLTGLYAGQGAESHRAAIPAVISLRCKMRSEELEERSIRKFTFNVKEGFFKETIDTPFSYIEHMTYVHQKYIRLLVTSIKMSIKKNQHAGTILLEHAVVNQTDDIKFEPEKEYDYTNMQVSGRTTSHEDGSNTQNLHMFMKYPPDTLTIPETTEEARFTFFMAVDKIEGAAKADFDSALYIMNSGGHDELFRLHAEAWTATWEKGKVEVYGDTSLSKLTTISQYYLLSSLPPLYAQQQPQADQIYYGASRTGLAKGGMGKDYRGHLFWDTEMYIMPAILPFHPSLAKLTLRYRSAFSTMAQAHAESMGAEGYRFPWESAFGGNDVTPDGCTECRDRQLYVTAAVAWAIRQYWSATYDKDYHNNKYYYGCDMTREIARFLQSLAVYDSSQGRYDVNNVMGPDDWHPNVNNNVFTNVLISLALHWARYFACVCGRNERTEVPDEWLHKALYLNLPFDNEKRVHYQHDGYDLSTNKSIKQADTIMLTYPVNWNMSWDVMRNDLEYYEAFTSDRTPAMTWSFFTVGWKWVNEENRMSQYFTKSYNDYIIQPFKIWTEYNERNSQDQLDGSVNYLPGAGGFIQSLVYGFAGVRYRPEFLEFHHPTPPPRCNRMLLKGFNYIGAEMDIEIWKDRVTIKVLDIGSISLKLRMNDSYNGEELMTKGFQKTIENPKDGFYIMPQEIPPCEHPRDYIYMPWGYSPWIAAAPTVRGSHLSMLAIGLLISLLTTASR